MCVLQAFQQHIEQKKLCKATDKILVAVSGGLDSMVLMHLFQEAGYQIRVAHANFQLRGIESDGDEEFVRHWCSRLGLYFYSQRFETNNYATERGISTQMAARELRYHWFEQVANQEKFDWIATAHHAYDSVETVLLNLTKGAGIEGLTGIEVQNQKIIRPLLFASRESIEEFAAAKGIAWREDQSNASDDYQRNFIRHQVVPRLKQLNPSFAESIVRSITKLQGTEVLSQIGLRQWKKQYEVVKGNEIHLSKLGLKTLAHPESVLYALIKEFGFNLAQCEDIVKSLDGQSGKKFSAERYGLVIDRTEIILYKFFNAEEVFITNEANHYQLGSLNLSVWSESLPNISKAKNAASLDVSKLTFPLKWRKWKLGDSFQPLGMKQKKKLSDYFIDEKLTLADKEQATVIESRGEIVWVVGQRIDDRYKITDETTNSFILDCGF